MPVAALACPYTQIPGASGVLLQSGGSTLVIAVLSTSSGFLGKLLTGQIPFLMTLTVVIGAAFGALGGEWSHRRVSPRALRYVYAGMVMVIALTVWISILG